MTRVSGITLCRSSGECFQTSRGDDEANHRENGAAVIRAYVLYLSSILLGVDTAKIFQNGRSQTVRLPKAYRFDGKEVFIKNVGGSVVLTPVGASWDAFFESLSLFSNDFVEERKKGNQQTREGLFE